MGTASSAETKRYLLFDHDGVLVDTEYWYYRAGRRALDTIGIDLPRDAYLQDMSSGNGTWARARAAGVSEATIDELRVMRDRWYREYLVTESIEIPGVLEALGALSTCAHMAIVTTAKRTDFELIHAERSITQFMDFVLVREDYEHAKPHPEPYLTALNRYQALKSQTLVVEDSARGLNSAVAAGIDCVIVRNDFTRGGDFSRARYRIDNLAELVGLLDHER
ncbi:MAG: HAD family phosphatase [Actinomycetota bacterium]